MPLREFFKPTKGKIIGAFILLLPAIFNVGIGRFFFVIIHVLPLRPIWSLLSSPIFDLFNQIYVSGGIRGVKLFTVGDIIALVLSIIWAYLLACIISFIYRKIKKRK